MSVLVTTIIPTASRPDFLSKAIESAIGSAPAESSEVIIVPNGQDDSWRRLALHNNFDGQVRWEPIDATGANHARNHGLSLATGKYIRFLDDDDFLYPEACQLQLREIESVAADVCSGCVDITDRGGKVIKTWCQPNTDDIAAAAIGPSRMTAVHAHLYRASSIGHLRWREDCSVRQDTDWFLRYASVQKRKWIRVGYPTGAWVQHNGIRVSRGKDPGHAALRDTVELILTAMSQLESANLVTKEHRIAASDGLWASVQKGLMYDYRYWKAIATHAESFARHRRPPSIIHRTPLARLFSPLLIETFLIPLRTVYRPLRAALERRGIRRS